MNRLLYSDNITIKLIIRKRAFMHQFHLKYPKHLNKMNIGKFDPIGYIDLYKFIESKFAFIYSKTYLISDKICLEELQQTIPQKLWEQTMRILFEFA